MNRLCKSLLALACLVLAVLVCAPDANARGFRARSVTRTVTRNVQPVFRRQVVVQSNVLRADQFGRVFLNGVPVVQQSFVTPFAFSSGFVQPTVIQSFGFRSLGVCR